MNPLDEISIKEFVLDSYSNGEFSKFSFGDVEEQYTCIIFYPQDFTFVCPTELRKISELNQQFLDLKTRVVCCSNDSIHSHKAWSNRSVHDGGLGPMSIPMLSDKNNKLSKYLGLFNEKEGYVCRSTLIYDNKNGTGKYLSVYDDAIGRSSFELMRLLEAFDFNEVHGNVCPIDFKRAN
ncbi:TDX [Enterospora canceri]|uniref:TDX n=1 Tax=Enterospora canceri TaxID=1081671 RepID=A0A1Y1S6A2_9MICR|nr:TDX [Enterospora canceri]